jgi:hypothetical protein
MYIFRTGLLSLIGLVALAGSATAQNQSEIPVEIAIPGYYAFMTDDRQLILDTQSGVAFQNADWGRNESESGPQWELNGRRLAYHRGGTLYIDDPLASGAEQVIPYRSFFMDDWSADGQSVLGVRQYSDSPFDAILRLRLDTQTTEQVAQFNRQELLVNGLVMAGVQKGMSVNPAYGQWVQLGINAVRPEQFADLGVYEVLTTSVPLLLNLETQQRIYLSQYLRNPQIASTYGFWSQDGERLYLVEDPGWVHELRFSPDGTVTPLASASLADRFVENPDYNLIFVTETVGISDLFMVRRFSNIIQAPYATLIRLARIVDDEVIETGWFALDRNTLSTERLSSGSFLLTADAAQEAALSCIIDVGPTARLQIGGTGRVTLTDTSGTRLRTEPGVTGSILQTMPDGTAFTVITGPYCIDSLKWWQVQLADGTTGWAAEGTADGYFLEPGAVETATPTPTPSPTPTSTPVPFQRIRLTALCSANPDAYRVWRVRNPNPREVVVTWDVYRSTAGQNGFVIAPPAQASTPGEVTFITQTEAGPNTVRLFVDGVQQDVKASTTARC